MKICAKTDIGNKRSMNQDYFYYSENAVGSFQNLFIVADGMGGHRAGDYASRLCVETIVESIKNSGHNTPVTVFNESVMAANEAVYNAAKENKEYEGMGTTVVACTLEGNTLYIANIGDSRLYIIRDEIYQVTNDHSLVEEMVKNGKITENEAKKHPNKNIITRALGINLQVHADYFEIDVKKSDRILMCTDGLTNMVRDDEILDIIKKYDNAQAATMQLVKEANANGGRDNITVMIIKPF